MPIVDGNAGTRIDEIADGIFRIATPAPGFSFNQYLILDDEPLLYHTGLRGIFPLTRAAIETVTPVAGLRHIAFSHVEADECGALNEFLAIAPNARPLCSDIAAMVSINDIADRAPRAIADGETITLGRHRVTWIATPHLPHAWECGHLFEETTKTLFCGDLFTQGGGEHPPVTTGDILEPSEAFRAPFDYYSHTANGKALIEKLAALNPRLLACMHGSAWRGDGAMMLRALGARLSA